MISLEEAMLLTHSTPQPLDLHFKTSLCSVHEVRERERDQARFQAGENQDAVILAEIAKAVLHSIGEGIGPVLCH